MTTHDPGAGFERLWPTIILNRRVPGHEAPDAALRELILRLERDNPALTTEYRGTGFLERPEAACTWLAGCINVSVRDYFAHLRMDYDIRWTVDAWPNVNHFGDYHDAHNHPRAYLSGTYYVQVPEPEPRPRATTCAPGTSRSTTRAAR